jgi:DNA-binding HxlR family transcriptional regulator
MTTPSTLPHFVHPHTGAPLDPQVEAVVRAIIGRVADKWSLIALEVLTQHACLRFSEVRRQVGPVSQKVLTQVLRGMEEDGLLTRTVHAEVPPRVDYALTPLGRELSWALCGVWQWAERYRDDIAEARRRFAAREGTDRPAAR